MLQKMERKLQCTEHQKIHMPRMCGARKKRYKIIIKIYREEPITDRQKKIRKVLRRLGKNDWQAWAELVGACNKEFKEKELRGELVR